MLSIVHLSDIHLSTTFDNSLFQKKEQLFKAINSEIRNSDHIVVLISGDIANYGIEEEYDGLAIPFFLELEEAIDKELSNPLLEFIFIPGNHDCNFSNKVENDKRLAFIKVVSNEKIMANNPLVVSEIIKVQENFEKFKIQFHEQWKKSNLAAGNHLFERVVLEHKKKKIIFNLFNTSWISTIEEKPAQLYYPINLADSIALSQFGDINISAFHHPTHWLEPNNKREMEELLTKISDFIITGHEHVSSKGTFTDWSNRSIHHIEGAALQDLSDASVSGFNVIHIQIEDLFFSIKNYSWNSLFYDCNEEEDNWKAISIGETARANDRKMIRIKDEFSDYINNLEVPVNHPRINNLRLNDIYVYPNVEEIIYDDKDETRLHKYEIAEILKDDKESIMVFSGDKDAGKTALSKMLFQHFLESKYFPLLLSGTELSPALAKKLDLLIEKTVNKVYLDVTSYKQLERSKRILIIDDWHKTSINSQTKMGFLNQAKKYFNQVIITSESNNSVNDSIKMYSTEENYNIRHFDILSFGNVKRNEFIERWITLGQRDILENSDLVKEIDRINRALKPMLQSYVPKYPLYLLIIIKTVEAKESVNFDKSSNAYYFEVLIKDSLGALQLDNSETDMLYQYLTDLSNEMRKKGKSLTNDEWREFHNRHLEYYDMTDDQLSFKDIRTRLEKEKIVKFGVEGYEYYYSYMYYFFVAQYLARKINKPEIREIIISMCSGIHITDNANILMFLTHLSKDDFIKSQVITAAERIFREIPHLRLEDDVNLINELCEELSPLILQDVDVREHRKKLDEQMDERERELMHGTLNEVSATGQLGEDEAHGMIEKVNVIDQGFKMLDIIGQILRNYYGSLSGEDKYKLCEELFKLGLRINHSLIEDLRDNNKPLIEYIASIILDKNLENNKERAEKLAKKILHFLGSLITYNSIVRIAASVGTSDLDQTYKRVQQSLQCNSVDLAYLSIKLEYYDKFPYSEVKKLYQGNNNNTIVKQIIRQMVRRHLYMYEPSRTERQRICDLVEITFKPKTSLSKR